MKNVADAINIVAKTDPMLAASLEAVADAANVCGWSVKINRRLTTTAGRCIHGRQTIDLNADLTDEQFNRTFAHELCHAIAGWGVGHGFVWQNLMYRVGLRPDRCHSYDNLLAKRKREKLVAVCTGCSHKIYRARKTSKYSNKNRHYIHVGCGGRVVSPDFDWEA